jgi:hypothetical protein
MTEQMTEETIGSTERAGLHRTLLEAQKFHASSHLDLFVDGGTYPKTATPHQVKLSSLFVSLVYRA